MRIVASLIILRATADEITPSSSSNVTIPPRSDERRHLPENISSEITRRPLAQPNVEEEGAPEAAPSEETEGPSQNVEAIEAEAEGMNITTSEDGKVLSKSSSLIGSGDDDIGGGKEESAEEETEKVDLPTTDPPTVTKLASRIEDEGTTRKPTKSEEPQKKKESEKNKTSKKDGEKKAKKVDEVEVTVSFKDKDIPRVEGGTKAAQKKGNSTEPSAKAGKEDVLAEKIPVHQTCELLGKFGSFGWWVQGFLMLMCFLSLIYKRFVDTVRRSWTVWFFDVSKQGFGTCLTHALNLCLAKSFELLVNVEADACNWYFINITMDTTLGCLIVMSLLMLLNQFYIKVLKRPELARIGEYGNPPNWSIWRKQLFDYMCLTVVEKLCMVILVVLTAPTLTYIVGFGLDLFSDYPNVKLTIVMVIWPLICSIGYFWIVDNFLQAKETRILVPGDETETRSFKRHSTNTTNITFVEDEIFNFEDWKRRKGIKN